METGDCHQIFLGWLREQRDSFLLIYDNYHNGLLDLDTFMPYGADVGCVPCHVLVTTRLEDYELLNWTGHPRRIIKVGGMKLGEARELLQTRCGELPHGETDCSSEINKLLSHLHYMPLMIKLAANTLSQSLGPLLARVTRYTKAFQNTDERQEKDLLSGYWTACQLALERMSERKDPHYQTAMECIALFVFIRHNNVPSRLFEETLLNLRRRSTYGRLSDWTMNNLFSTMINFEKDGDHITADRKRKEGL